MGTLRRPVIMALLGAMLLALGACGSGEEPRLAPLRDPEQMQVLERREGELHAYAQIYPKRVAFGAVIEVDVELAAPARFTELAWDQGVRAGHLQLLSLEPLGTQREVETQKARWRARFEAPRSGRVLGRLAPLRARAGAETQPIELHWPTFAIEVEAPSEASAPRFEDLPGPLPIIEIPSERNDTAWIASAIAAASALGLGALWWSRRRRPEASAPPPDPREEARAALEELRRSGLIEGELYGELYYRLTHIVRLYLERATGLRAPEQTTEEFLREIEEHPAYPTSAKQELRAFLSAADPVKYAAQRPDASAIGRSLEAALRLVDSIHAVEANAP